MRLVLVHGFTQTGRSWDPVAAGFEARHDVVRVDLPGHGDVPPLDGGGFEAVAAALGKEGGAAVYVGYSMGGRLALRLALDRPDLVEGLVLVGASPGLVGPSERSARREADERLAGQIERDGVDAFLEQWLAQPMFAGLSPEAAGLEHRRASTAAGLAWALRTLGPGRQAPLWGRLGAVTAPTLLVVGEHDEKFTAVARRMVAAMPAAGLRVIAGAGHAAHLERPDAFAEAVEAFVAGRVGV